MFPISIDKGGDMTSKPYPRALQAAKIEGATAENFVPLEALRKGIDIVIPWSDDFRAGGTIKLHLSGGGSGTFHELDIDKFPPEQDLRDSFQPEEIRDLWDSKVELYYFDQNLNRSPISTYSFAAELYRPRVPGIIDNEGLPWSQAAQGFTINIPAYEGASAGELIRLFLIGQHPNSSFILETEVIETGEQTVFFINETISSALSGGMVYLHYYVINTTIERSSRPLSFMMGSLVAAPIAKYVLWAGGDMPFVLNPIDEPKGKYPFITNFGLSLERDDEVFFLVLDDRSWQNEVIVQKISTPTLSADFLASKPIIDNFNNSVFLIATLLRRHGKVLASNSNLVNFPEDSTKQRPAAGPQAAIAQPR